MVYFRNWANWNFFRSIKLGSQLFVEEKVQKDKSHQWSMNSALFVCKKLGRIKFCKNVLVGLYLEAR